MGAALRHHGVEHRSGCWRVTWRLLALAEVGVCGGGAAGGLLASVALGSTRLPGWCGGLVAFAFGLAFLALLEAGLRAESA